MTFFPSLRNLRSEELNFEMFESSIDVIRGHELTYKYILTFVVNASFLTKQIYSNIIVLFFTVFTLYIYLTVIFK